MIGYSFQQQQSCSCLARSTTIVSLGRRKKAPSPPAPLLLAFPSPLAFTGMLKGKKGEWGLSCE
jgi:hypothetical protein